MFINGVKITFTICLTIIVCCVLSISFSEYTNRYTIVPVSDNSVYIFDKKSTTLNKCDKDGCQLLDTKLPSTGSSNIYNQITQTPSKLFGENKTMQEEVIKVEATPKEEKSDENKEENKEEIKEPLKDKSTEPQQEKEEDKATTMQKEKEEDKATEMKKEPLEDKSTEIKKEEDKTTTMQKEKEEDKAENNDDEQNVEKLANKKQIKTRAPITVKKRNK